MIKKINSVKKPSSLHEYKKIDLEDRGRGNLCHRYQPSNVRHNMWKVREREVNEDVLRGLYTGDKTGINKCHVIWNSIMMTSPPVTLSSSSNDNYMETGRLKSNSIEICFLFYIQRLSRGITIGGAKASVLKHAQKVALPHFKTTVT